MHRDFRVPDSCAFSLSCLAARAPDGKHTGKGNESPKGVISWEEVWKERIRGLEGVRKQSKWSRNRGPRALKAQDGNRGSGLRSRPGFRKTGLRPLWGSGQGPRKGSMCQEARMQAGPQKWTVAAAILMVQRDEWG